MEDFLKMDIFFGVTTVAVVVISTLLALVLIRVFALLKKIENLTDLVTEEGEDILEDIREVRERVKQTILGLGQVFGLMRGVKKAKRSTKKASS